MNSLAELFSVEDFNSNGKSAGKFGKNTSPKQKKKEEKGIRYALPVRVCSGLIRCTITREQFSGKTISEDEVKQEIRKNYPELGGIQFTLVKFNNKYTSMLEGLEKAKTEIKESSIVVSVTKAKNLEDKEEPLDIPDAENGENDASIEEIELEDKNEDVGNEEPKEKSDYQTSYEKGCWVKLDIHYQEAKKEQEFSVSGTIKAGKNGMGYEKDTSLEEISDMWVKACPVFKNCRFHYDERNQYLIPYMIGGEMVKGKKYLLPIQVGFLEMEETYTSADFGEGIESVSWNELRALYAKKYPEYENASFIYQEEENSLFPIVEFKREAEKEAISIPVRVRGSGFIMELTTEDFKGSSSATLEEIRFVIEQVYPEFSKERTEMIYDERGFVIPVLKGSRKGMIISCNRKNQGFYEVDGLDGHSYRIEQMPYGCFDCRDDGETVDFHLMADKIPKKILMDIFSFFQLTPNKEAAIQIFYDIEKKSYELYYPRQTVTASSVVFQRNYDMELKKILVMDAHSHGKMPAFFSSIDNHDEKGTRLFLVCGNLDRKQPSYKLRAGIVGNYKTLLISEIFDMGDKV